MLLGVMCPERHPTIWGQSGPSWTLICLTFSGDVFSFMLLESTGMGTSMCALPVPASCLSMVASTDLSEAPGDLSCCF